MRKVSKPLLLVVLLLAFSSSAGAVGRDDLYGNDTEVGYEASWSRDTVQVNTGGKTATIPNPCSYKKTVMPPFQVSLAVWAIDEGNKRQLQMAGTDDSGIVLKDKVSGEVKLTSYVRNCPGRGEDLVWIGDGGDEGNIPVLTHEMIAEFARKSLRIPISTVKISPDPWEMPDRPPLVNMPISWWVEASPVTGPRASAGPMWVDVVATPRATSWKSSEGEVTKCSSLGAAWTPQMTVRNPALCNVEYAKSHDPEVAQVMVTWDLAWRGNGGRSGTLPPVTVIQEFTLPVCQRQIVIVQNDGPRPPKKKLIPGTCHD